MPNAFSPNGDGVNEILAPIYSCITGYKLTIYNRWGEIEFSGESYEGWDGTRGTLQAEPGVYSYLLEYSGIANNSEYKRILRGSVVLQR